MKKALLLFVIAIVAITAFSQTSFKLTGETFKNGEQVWSVSYSGNVVGEFWPVNNINLVTNSTNPELFNAQLSLDTIQQMLGGVATAPDGMTTASNGRYALEGRCLSNGISCGDGSPRNYGIITIVDNRITFTHLDEISDFDSYYEGIRHMSGTLFFLPSIFRNGRYLSSSRTVDKVFIRRDTPDGPQIGVVIFNRLVTYDEAREIICGLDRKTKDGKAISTTTHIYVLDGGPTWGQSCKEVNGQVVTIGTRNPAVVTNYLVFY